MTSPDITKSGQCLTFWYHMYGQHIHILNIYLKSKGVLGSPVWTKQGTHGDMWRKGEVSLIGATPFQVILQLFYCCCEVSEIHGKYQEEAFEFLFRMYVYIYYLLSP